MGTRGGGWGGWEAGDWKRDSSPRTILPIRVGREQERRLRSPAGGKAPTNTAAIHLPGTCLKGSGCGDESRSWLQE